MSRALFLLSLLFFYWFPSHGQSQDQYSTIGIYSPDFLEELGPGSIEEVSISLRPLGIYTEAELSFTLTDRDVGLVPGDTMVIYWEFTLPRQSIVHDATFLIREESRRADMLELEEAFIQFENLVERTKVDSVSPKMERLLVAKDGVHQYSVRVFPVLSGEPVGLKLSVLLPTEWDEEQVSTFLPVQLLLGAQDDPPEVEFRVEMEDRWGKPSFEELPDIEFTTVAGTGVESFWSASLSPAIYLQKNRLRLLTDAPLHEGIYVSHNEEERIYQMVLMPEIATDLSPAPPKKLAVLMDYKDGKTSNFSRLELLEEVRIQLLDNLETTDSFNLILGDFGVRFVSDHWLPATPENIDSAFAGIAERFLSDRGSLEELLLLSTRFVRDNGPGGEMLLLSNSDRESSPAVVERIVTELKFEMKDIPYIPMHILDFEDEDEWQDPHTNEALYNDLTRITEGHHLQLRQCCSNSLKLMASNFFEQVTGRWGRLRIATWMDSIGMNDHIQVGNTDIPMNLRKPYYGAGRYNGGKFPLIIRAGGTLDEEQWVNGIWVESEHIHLTDTLVEEIFMGARLRALEHEKGSAEITAEIVDLSVRERVLSIHTALLALDTAFTVCLNCPPGIDSVTVGLDGNHLSDDLLRVEAFPNPFSTQTLISMRFGAQLDRNGLHIGIYDLNGRVVRTFAHEDFQVHGDTRTIPWRGENEEGGTVASGIYFLIARNAQGSKTLNWFIFHNTVQPVTIRMSCKLSRSLVSAHRARLQTPFAVPVPYR